MSNCSANTPRLHKFAISEYNTAKDAAFTRRLAVSRFGMRGATGVIQDDGISGSLWDQKGDEVITNVRVGGQLELNPRAADLQSIWRCIVGGAAFSSNQKLPGDICDYFQVGHADPVTDRIYRYDNCVTSEAVFSASDSAQLLKLVWSIEGQSRQITDDVDANWPSLTLSTQQPFVFRQGVLTLGGTVYRMKDFSFTARNNLLLDDFFNSLTREEMPITTQQFLLTHTVPWDLGADVDRIGTLQQISADLDFQAGTKRMRLEFPCLEAFIDEPEIVARNRVLGQFTWKAKYDSSHAIAAPVRITVVTS